MIYESDLATIVNIVKDILLGSEINQPTKTRDKILLDSKQVSKLLGITEKTLSKYRKLNKIKYIQQGANYTVRYDPDDINEFINQNRINGTPKFGSTK